MEDVDHTTEVHGFRGPAIDLAAIQRELSGLWRMPMAGERDGEVVPTRTSVLNLVVYADDEDLAARATRVIEHLATSHPSRVLIFVATDDQRVFAGDVDARVSTHCFATSGDRFAACFEQVMIPIPKGSLEYLPSMIVPLAIPDLPTFVWWLGQPPLGNPGFHRAVQFTDRLIVDSLDYTRCLSNIVRAAELCRKLGESCSMTDLNWGRLFRWRDMSAQFFDMPEFRWALDHITRVRLTYGLASSGSRVNPCQAFLFLGWLASRLGWRAVDGDQGGRSEWALTARDPHDQSIDITIRNTPIPRTLNGHLSGIEITADDGSRSAQFELSRCGDDQATIRMIAESEGRMHLEQAVRAAPFELRSLLVHQLKRLGHDDFYEAALQDAGRFVERLRSRTPS